MQYFQDWSYIGLPIGDSKTTSTLNIGVYLSYLLNFSDKFSFGLTTGYTS
jgi:hypothetical protein